MSIVLIGYRGSGKTTVGRLLSIRLSQPFVDSDEKIVTTAGKSIKEIFEQHGEEKFRDWETEVIREIALLQNHVLSLGGGALLRDDNRRAIWAGKHTVVYLRADPVELHRRIHQDAATAAHRPSLTRLGGGIEEIRSVLAGREPIYRQMMSAELDVTRASTEEAVEMILKLVHKPATNS
jgi:shikimate kinase